MIKNSSSNSEVTSLESMVNNTCFVNCESNAKIKIAQNVCAIATLLLNLWQINITKLLIRNPDMQNEDALIKQLKENNNKLTEINTNMLKVFGLLRYSQYSILVSCCTCCFLNRFELVLNVDYLCRDFYSHKLLRW